MKEVVWKGIFPALITPFTPDDKPDLGLFEKSLEAQLSAGVHGIVLGGSLGEASTLEDHEKDQPAYTAKLSIVFSYFSTTKKTCSPTKL